MRVLDQCVDDGLRVLAWHLNQHHVTRVAFNQSGDLAVIATHDQITFPVARYRTILGFCRAFTDRYRVGDLAQPLAFKTLVPGSAHRSGLAKVLQQLFLQGPAGLDEQALVDRLV